MQLEAASTPTRQRFATCPRGVATGGSLNDDSRALREPGGLPGGPRSCASPPQSWRRTRDPLPSWDPNSAPCSLRSAETRGVSLGKAMQLLAACQQLAAALPEPSTEPEARAWRNRISVSPCYGPASCTAHRLSMLTVPKLAFFFTDTRSLNTRPQSGRRHSSDLSFRSASSCREKQKKTRRSSGFTGVFAVNYTGLRAQGSATTLSELFVEL